MSLGFETFGMGWRLRRREERKGEGFSLMSGLKY